MKTLDQKSRDQQRKTYRLYFPHELNAESVTSWIRSISGTLRSSRTGLTGLPTVAFELWATSDGIQHRLKVPWQHADYVVSQLRSLVPGIRVTPEDEFPHRLWRKAVEVGLTHSTRQLRIYSPSATATSLLASVQALEPTETVVMQWVITPAIPTHAPIYRQSRSNEINLRTLFVGDIANKDEVNDRRGKLQEPNVRAVLRVAAFAETDIRAAHLIYRVRASLASTRGPSTRFTKRHVPKATLQKRLDLTQSPLIFPMQLSAPELASLIAWPIDNPFVSGLPPALARQLPAPDQVPRDGRVIGRSNFPGNERPIAIGFEDALKHVHVIGPTGVGKTVMLGNMIRQDIANGYGVVLIENKGDLFDAAMDYVPWERMEDVIMFDVNDRKHPVGFNILNQGEPDIVVDEIASLFEHLYRDASAVWVRKVLYHALRTIITNPKLTFVDIAPLLSPMSKEEGDWADSVIRGVKDREVRNFWQQFHNQPRAAQDRVTQPVMDRIWQLNARPEIRNIIGQSDSTFRMTDVVRDNKILLVNLKGVPTQTAALTGTLIMNALWHAVKTTKSDKPTFLYLDEFQDFINLPIDPESMLAKSRSLGLGMTLAHQHLGQLPTELRQAVVANARTKIIFQTTADDAKAMSREFGSSVSEHDFMHMGKYEALVRVATAEGVSPPLTMAASEPAPGHYFSREVRKHSQERYGRPVGQVEKDILDRRAIPVGPKTKRPNIGTSEGWGQP